MVRARRRPGGRRPPLGRPRKVTVSEWVRLKCLYGCGDSGIYKTCPPNAAPLDEHTNV